MKIGVVGTFNRDVISPWQGEKAESIGGIYFSVLYLANLLSPADEVILPKPSFLFYEIAVRSSGALPVWVPLKSFNTDLQEMIRKVTSRTRMIFLNVPHNPAGTIISKSDFEN